jgi:hypothetical protein
MKFFLGVILIAVLSAVAEYFLPWWSMAVVCFVVSLLMGLKGGKSFLMGFSCVALCWLTFALIHDIPNEHILSTRMAKVFGLPNYGLFILVTVVVGGLIGGLASWAGALLKMRKPNY